MEKNRRKPIEKVRDRQYTIWVNRDEDRKFQALLEVAGSMKPKDFLRQMITKGYVQASPKKNIDLEGLFELLIEYRTNFNRISSLIKARQPSLTMEIEILVRSLQKLMDRI